MVAITTITGSATIDGTSGALGNDTDTDLLLGLRAWADVVLVGATTARKERYGPAAHGTPVAVISRTLNFTGEEEFLNGPTMVLTPRSSLDHPDLAERRRLLGDAGVDLISTGTGSATEIVAALHQAGCEKITCEGGPGIYGLMLASNLVDVAHITLSPHLAAPVEKPLVSARPDGGIVASSFQLEMVAPTYDGTVFLRYRRPRND